MKEGPKKQNSTSSLNLGLLEFRSTPGFSISEVFYIVKIDNRATEKWNINLFDIFQKILFHILYSGTDVAPKIDQVAERQSSLKYFSFFFQNKKYKGFPLILKE